ncbi:MAG: hypothetical protein IJ560_04185 [Alphaproteobacteria bacterium]|nr:hypothetical protein [Alphaproteobacteria bacterium]
MKRIFAFVGVFFICTGAIAAAVRSAQSPTRNITTTNARADTKSKNITARNNMSTTTMGRATTNRTAARSTTTNHATPRNATRGTVTITKSPRVASRTQKSANANIIARATSGTPIVTQTFGAEYTDCRDAYFTCMDQFCAQQNESYRRCVCSSRLTEIQNTERRLSQTADSLTDFNDLNISVITKSAAEVNAMISASDGEIAQSYARDKSAAAKELSGISAVLANTKTNATSTAGKLDIGGDIKSIWATTDLAGGASIANLTGEKLYNAVHNQCSEMVRETCGSDSALNMVASAYGMYIENDCTTLSNALDKKVVAANATIRDAGKQMHAARLENYDNHNATPIHDCIANVRADMTGDNACGANYVHCLDITGKYLNYDTGEPIYTAQFYQLGNMISLDGDILNNQRNSNIVADLNRRRAFAEHSMDTCRDISDNVWNEFMRQAITEIYQGQQSRIRQVKNECLDVVSQCYDEQNAQLKDFSNVKDQLLLGSRLELSEQMCQEKMDTCSNLYGNGEDGLKELLIAMHDIIDQRIAQNCLSTLTEFVKDICDVSSSNTTHKYPYACRSYTPGDSMMGADYNNSLYKQIVDYAKQACVRPSMAETDNNVPINVLADVNAVMDSVRLAMASELSIECESLGGYWVSAQWIDKEKITTKTSTGDSAQSENENTEDGVDGLHDTTGHTLYSKFYLEIAADTGWGYCANPDSLGNYIITDVNGRVNFNLGIFQTIKTGNGQSSVILPTPTILGL